MDKDGGSKMNYPEALGWLDQLGVFGVRLGLERIRRLMELLGNPQDRYRTIHVTGTNGKGSVCAMLAQIFERSGIHTGRYISPHLHSYTERIQIDGQDISEEDFAGALTAVREKVERMTAEGEECPTQFEVLTAAAFLYFAEKRVEYAVIEVGLGGLLDSTNVITPEISVITNVAFEHAALCGGTLEGIAHHKAGIIKDGVPVVTAASGKPLEIIREEAERHGSDIFVLGEDFEVEGGDYGPGGQQLFFSSSLLGQSRCEGELRLLGDHQLKNAAVAIMACCVLHNVEPRLTADTIRSGLALTEWPCRFEYLQMAGQDIIIDGAHNPAGMRVLRESLDKYFPDRARVLLLGILHDKDVEEMLRILVRPTDDVVMTPPQSDRAERADVLAAAARPYAAAVTYDEDNARALALAREYASGGKLLVMAGSLYLVGGLRAMMVGRSSRGNGRKENMHGGE